MKCHYIQDKEAGSVLIPECWAVVLSGDITDCHCKTSDKSRIDKLEARIKKLESIIENHGRKRKKPKTF